MLSFLTEPSFQFKVEDYCRNQKLFGKGATVVANALIPFIMNEGYQFFSILDELTGKGELYYFTGRCYEQVTIAEVGQFYKGILTFLGITYSTRARNEFYNQLVETVELDHERYEEINNYPHIVPFKDRYYHRKRKQFIKPHPKFLFTETLSVCWPDEFTHPLQFDTWLKSMFDNDQDYFAVLEYLSYCLSSRIDWQYHQIWTGPPGTGKTELTNFLHLALGSLVAFVPLGDMMDKGKNRFILSELKGKWVNLGSELGKGMLSEQGVQLFKRLVTNKHLRSEEKNQKGGTMSNMLKGIYDINELDLPTKESDEAFFSRLQIIPFRKIIPKNQREKDLMKKIFEKEGANICRWLVTMDLPDNYRQDPDESEMRWKLNMHSVFLYNELFLMEGETETRELYDNYLLFCQTWEIPSVSPSIFGRNLARLGFKKHRVTQLEQDGFVERKIRVYKYPCESSFVGMGEIEDNKNEVKVAMIERGLIKEKAEVIQCDNN